MAGFKDHLKAEIFAQTFSRIFFSGPAGRIVAIVFTIFYVLFAATLAVMALVLKSVFKTFSAIVSAYRNSQFRRRTRAVRELKLAVRKFGDRFETRKGQEWVAYEISGTGFRSGEFSLAFAHHPKSGAVRIFRSTAFGQSEFAAHEILGYCARENGFPRMEDFSTVYRNLRNHFL